MMEQLKATKPVYLTMAWVSLDLIPVSLSLIIDTHNRIAAQCLFRSRVSIQIKGVYSDQGCLLRSRVTGPYIRLAIPSRSNG